MRLPVTRVQTTCPNFACASSWVKYRMGFFNSSAPHAPSDRNTLDLSCASTSGSTVSRARRGDRTIGAWPSASCAPLRLGSRLGMLPLGRVDADITHPFTPCLEFYLDGISIKDLRDACRQGLCRRGWDGRWWGDLVLGWARGSLRGSGVLGSGLCTVRPHLRGSPPLCSGARPVHRLRMGRRKIDSHPAGDTSPHPSRLSSRRASRHNSGTSQLAHGPGDGCSCPHRA